MSDVSGRKRQPKGIPTGGEFASNMHDEAVLPLEEEEPPQPPYIPIYTVQVSHLGAFREKIDRANARLERAGVEDRFTMEYEERIIHREDGTLVQVADITLSKPRIKAGDWEFESTHELTENGDVISYYSVEDADRTPVMDMGCEQCGVKRHRGKVYRVRNSETGETKQIGGSCLNIFTGVKPEGLWSLTYQPDIEDLEYSEDDDLGSGFSYGSSVVADDRNLLLATIRAVNASDRGFISKSSAGWNETPTSDVVKSSYRSLTADEASAEESAEIDAVLSYVRSLEDDSDFSQNLRTIYKQSEDGTSYIKGKHFGIATYALESYRRDIRKKAERAEREKINAKKAKSYLAPTGTKISDLRKQLKKEGKDDTIRARVLSVRAGTPVQVSYYEEKTPHHVTMMTEDGHVIYWRASDHVDVSGGEVVSIDSGTVKDTHVSDFNGDYETVLTRTRLSVIERPSDGDE